jgi:hypothetical protein
MNWRVSELALSPFENNGDECRTLVIVAASREVVVASSHKHLRLDAQTNC